MSVVYVILMPDFDFQKLSPAGSRNEKLFFNAVLIISVFLGVRNL